MLDFGKCRDILNNSSNRKIAIGFINECYKIWSCAISLHVLLILINCNDDLPVLLSQNTPDRSQPGAGLKEKRIVNRR